jgi:hypothetical protein
MDSKHFGDVQIVTICDMMSLRKIKYMDYGYREKFEISVIFFQNY